MRKIKFRGRSINYVAANDSYWAYGLLVNDDPPEIECDDGDIYRVNDNTVGQYTGLEDADGREIYEGDIVKATLKDKSFVKRFHMDGTVTGKISFDGAWWIGERNALWRLLRYYELTVIGNIHDNPELLSIAEMFSQKPHFLRNECSKSAGHLSKTGGFEK